MTIHIRYVSDCSSYSGLQKKEKSHVVLEQTEYFDYELDYI